MKADHYQQISTNFSGNLQIDEIHNIIYERNIVDQMVEIISSETIIQDLTLTKEFFLFLIENDPTQTTESDIILTSVQRILQTPVTENLERVAREITQKIDTGITQIAIHILETITTDLTNNLLFLELKVVPKMYITDLFLITSSKQFP